MNLFHLSKSTIPRQDARIIRVAFEEVEVGARKSFLPQLSKTPQMCIVHVKGGGAG